MPLQRLWCDSVTLIFFFTNNNNNNTPKSKVAVTQKTVHLHNIHRVIKCLKIIPGQNHQLKPLAQLIWRNKLIRQKYTSLWNKAKKRITDDNTNKYKVHKADKQRKINHKL